MSYHAMNEKMSDSHSKESMMTMTIDSEFVTLNIKQNIM